jgi:hypothetical protein
LWAGFRERFRLTTPCPILWDLRLAASGFSSFSSKFEAVAESKEKHDADNHSERDGFPDPHGYGHPWFHRRADLLVKETHAMIEVITDLDDLTIDQR